MNMRSCLSLNTMYNSKTISLRYDHILIFISVNLRKKEGGLGGGGGIGREVFKGCLHPGCSQ